MPEYRALIVEDSPTMRQLICLALRRVHGLTVVEAGDGVDGLRKLSGERFDIIFTDINMPIMDGLKLVSLLRADPAYHETPIVIITTEGATEDRDRALSLGANDYITKPIQAATIVEVTKKLLKLQ
jgi:two-component system chemotaxis response regulator CheY